MILRLRQLFAFIPKHSSFRHLSWFRSQKNYDNVVDGLKSVYKTKLLPLETHHFFHEFNSPKLNDSDFEANPLVLVMGQYSTGKTTLIRYILQNDFPGMRIGPEPTTDCFMALMYDDKTGTVPGNALVVDPKKPFGPLAKYGNAFLTKFQCSTLPSPILKAITLIDTPGILSGEKQRLDRGYDFTGVLEWFAERVDRIILLFDAHKLDISDEFRRSIEALKGHDEKIRIILNKSDMVDHQSLMRVYGSLMWSLAKVFNTPEVTRVYVGSFWDKPLKTSINRQLFEDEGQDLFQDIKSLPMNAVLRKLNDLSKRARMAKVHAHLTEALRKEMPSVFGKEVKKKELIDNLRLIYTQLQKEHMISPGDFPEVNKMQERLATFDFSRFRRFNRNLMAAVDDMLASDIRKLMSMIPSSQSTSKTNELKDGAFVQVSDTSTPFGYKLGEGFDAGRGEEDWIVNDFRKESDITFAKYSPEGGKMARAVAKAELIKTELPSGVLSKIYSLSDVDDDGLLDKDEFALANYVIMLKLNGHDLPIDLPAHLIPPSKRIKADP